MYIHVYYIVGVLTETTQQLTGPTVYIVTYFEAAN